MGSKYAELKETFEKFGVEYLEVETKDGFKILRCVQGMKNVNGLWDSKIDFTFEENGDFVDVAAYV